MSVAGGLPEALARGRAAGCGVVQIFLKSQVRWAGRALGEDEVREFRRRRVEAGFQAVFAHASYLVNLAAPDHAEWRRGLEAFTDELARAERLGLPFVVIHPGSHRGAGREAGLRRVVAALDELTARTAGWAVRIVLENTAGAGRLLGAVPGDLGTMLAEARQPERLGVCLDTCHLFAAGHDIRTAAGLRGTVAAFEAAVGPGRVVACHLNDARAGLGSGLDRHQHIGRGRIGLGAFRALLQHPRLGVVPMVIETPKGDDWDARNLAVLRRLRAGPGRPAGPAAGSPR